MGKIKVDGAARRKGVIFNHLLAEAVNREDAGIVKERERLADAVLRIRIIHSHAAPETDLLHRERVGIRGRNRSGKEAERFREVRLNAGLQFRRCRTREGHHEEMVDRDSGFNDEAKHQMLDRKGLPGAGRRL